MVFHSKNTDLLVPTSESRCPLCDSSTEFSFMGRDLLYNKSETYRYSRCIRCETVYQDPIPSDEKINSFYPDHYGPYEKLGVLKQPSNLKLAVLRYRYGYAHLKTSRIYQFLAPVFSLLKYRNTIHFIPNGKALDIGCGNGEFMRNMNSLGWEFEGVEFNQKAVNVCRSAGLKVFHGSIIDAAFDENSFDLITARHLIEHIPDPKSFVSEIARILRKRGQFVIQTPNNKALGKKWFGATWFPNDVPRHLVLFNPENLRMLVECYGLRLRILNTSSTPKIILNSWDYLTGNRDKPSKSKKVLRLLARLYVMMGAITRRGDEVFAIFEKP
jgi:2-polyprenyl-3-methyl-5-hydroxy-6-metoxy-1,4-benzoquinol methylase